MFYDVTVVDRNDNQPMTAKEMRAEAARLRQRAHELELWATFHQLDENLTVTAERLAKQAELFIHAIAKMAS